MDAQSRICTHRIRPITTPSPFFPFFPTSNALIRPVRCKIKELPANSIPTHHTQARKTPKTNNQAHQYAQELLSTFSTSLGEVALQPSTGGTFVVEIFHPLSPSTSPSSPETSTSSSSTTTTQSRILWDRKADGGFPETKELKRRVRDVIEPGRDLGHVDRHGPSASTSKAKPGEEGVAVAPTTSSTTATTISKGGQKEGPSRAELEAAGQAGGGYPGSSEAAVQLVDDLREEGKEVCEDCN